VRWAAVQEGPKIRFFGVGFRHHSYGADYIDDLVWLGFKKVAQDIRRHKRAIELTIRDAIAKFAPLLKGRSMGTLGVEPEPLFRRQEYPNPRE
jgi:hypothetical protein